MKKIFKLRGELICLFILSVFLGFIACALTGSIAQEIISKEQMLKRTAELRNEEAVNFIKNNLELESKDLNIIKDNIMRISGDSRLSFSFNMYLIDMEGNVLLSANDLKISKIDITKQTDINIRINNNSFTANNIIPIDDNYLIVFSHTGYCGSDSYMMPIWVAFSITIFLILVRGRINYINKVSQKVQEISTGDLSIRVPLKYKNELTSLAEDVNNMAKELEEQDSREKEFITNISHDLRTPLTTMLGYLKMIEEKKYSNEDELEKYLNIISKKGNYLKDMLEDFFSYSKLASNDVKLDKVNINLNECLMQLLDGEDIEFEKRKLQLEVNLCKETLYTNADPMLIARAFENLISNAKKYSKEDTSVKIGLDKQKDYCLFKIINVPENAISAEEVELLFNRLYKKDKARKQQGSGLGLAITEEIVKAHHGIIKARIIGDSIEFEIKLK